MDISVVMPTYRRPAQLAEALRSVLAQEGVELEVLVIDDCPEGSAEATVRAIADARIRYIRNPHPSGGRPGRVRNFGWPLAQGEIIHFLDDDDLVPPRVYAEIRALFAAEPRIGVVFGRIEPFGEPEQLVRAETELLADGARRAARTAATPSRWLLTARMLFQPLMYVGGAAFVRRRCVAEVGGFDTDLPVMEDVDFHVQLVRRFGARYIDRVTLRYRIGPSLMHRPGIEPQIVGGYVAMQRNYRQTRGSLEYYLMKLAARTLLRLV